MSTLAQKLKDPGTTPETIVAKGRRLLLTPLNHIKTLPVRWVWRHRIAAGMFGLLAGREGDGKSLVACDITAKITRGTLEGDDRGKPRKVLICATEDSFEHTMVPRLIAANADLSKVARIEVFEGDRPGDLNLPADIPALAEQARINDVALIVLDPLMSRLAAKLDSHKDADVRRALEPIVKLADATGAAVLGIIHLNKSMAINDPNNMIMGSRAFSAVSRYTLMVTPDPEDDFIRLLGQAKNSVGPSHGLPLLPYGIESFLFTNEQGLLIETARVMWQDPDASRTFNDVMRGGGNQKDSARDKAEEWLQWFLEKCEGRKALSHEVKRAAEAAGHAPRTLDRAVQDLGILRQGGGRTMTWALPEPKLPLGGKSNDPGF